MKIINDYDIINVKIMGFFVVFWRINMFNIAICDDDLNTCSDIEKFILLYGKINNIDIWVNKFSKGL